MLHSFTRRPLLLNSNDKLHNNILFTENTDAVVCLMLIMTFVYEQEVVQRLFVDQEDEQGRNATDKNPETPTDKPPIQVTTVRNKLKVKLYAQPSVLSEVLAKTSSCRLLSSVPPLDSV